jgi:hypothetical protein
MKRIGKASPTHYRGYYMANKQCEHCGQVWRVPRRKSQQTDRLYFKLPKDQDHQVYDEIELRVHYVHKKYGESAIRNCIWAGCEKKALKKMAFCAFQGITGPAC